FRSPQNRKLVYARTAEGNDSLAWVNSDGESVTESQLAILRAAECTAQTLSAARLPNHHELVEKGVRYMVQEEKSAGGQLGRPSGARFRVYERLKAYLTHVQGMLFATEDKIGRASSRDRESNSVEIRLVDSA